VKAAAGVAVAQGGVCKTIGELETLVGVPLFERRGRGVAPTRHGEVFLRFAGASITALRQGIESVSQARGLSTVAVRVGALPTVSTTVMPTAIRLFKARHPGTT